MKPINRYRSQLLYRRSYRPARVLRFRPGAARLSFRPARRNCLANPNLAFLISY